MPLEAHRLLGGDGMAALIGPDAAIEWWCTPRLDSPPVLWRLLDDSGGAAVWRGAKPVRTVGRPAGPCARSIVDVDGLPVACWDGLVRVDGEPALIRLVRAVGTPVELTHELTLARFDPDATTGEHLLRVHTSDGEQRAAGPGVVHTSLTATSDRWSALVLQRSTVPAPPTDLATLRGRLRAADEEAAKRRPVGGRGVEPQGPGGGLPARPRRVRGADHRSGRGVSHDVGPRGAGGGPQLRLPLCMGP